VGAIFAGFINADPFTHALASFLHRSPELALLPHGDMNWGERSLLWLGSIVMALGGIGVAWWMYQKQRGFADKLAGDAPALYPLSLNKFYLDELYAAFIVQPMAGLAAVCRGFDRYLLDGVVDLIGQLPARLGQVFRPIQNGLVQFYALAMILGLLVFLL